MTGSLVQDTALGDENGVWMEFMNCFDQLLCCMLFAVKALWPLVPWTPWVGVEGESLPSQHLVAQRLLGFHSFKVGCQWFGHAALQLLCAVTAPGWQGGKNSPLWSLLQFPNCTPLIKAQLWLRSVAVAIFISLWDANVGPTKARLLHSDCL